MCVVGLQPNYEVHSFLILVVSMHTLMTVENVSFEISDF